MRGAIAVLVLLLVANLAPAAFAQGCALCRTSAAGLSDEGQKALDLAILDRKSTRLNSSHIQKSRMPSSA